MPTRCEPIRALTASTTSNVNLRRFSMSRPNSGPSGRSRAGSRTARRDIRSPRAARCRRTLPLPRCRLRSQNPRRFGRLRSWSAHMVMRREGSSAGPFVVAEGHGASSDPVRRANRLAALDGEVRYAPDVPQLREDAASGAVCRARHLAPTGDLVRRKDSRVEDVTLAFAGNRRSFRDDQSGRRTLGIVE